MKFSKQGYKKNSPDRFNSMNMIPSNHITMHGVPHPVLMIPMGGRGVGNPVLGQPGEDYFFPNHEMVMEFPVPGAEAMQYQRMQQGGFYDNLPESVRPVQPYNPGNWMGMVKSKIAYENEFGNNPAIKRMISPNFTPYTYPGGFPASHNMGSYGRAAIPNVQEVNGRLTHTGPRMNEAIMFYGHPSQVEGDARYFAENYRKVAPTFQPYMQEMFEQYKQQGGPIRQPLPPYLENRTPSPEMMEYFKEMSGSIKKKPAHMYFGANPHYGFVGGNFFDKYSASVGMPKINSKYAPQYGTYKVGYKMPFEKGGIPPVDSEEYRKLYESGKLATYDPETDTYATTPMDTVEITAEAPDHVKFREDAKKKWSKQRYHDEYVSSTLGRKLGETGPDVWHPDVQKKYDDFIKNQVAADILKKYKFKDTYDQDKRVEWLNKLSPQEKQILMTSPVGRKVSPTIFQEFKTGLADLANLPRYYLTGEEPYYGSEYMLPEERSALNALAIFDYPANLAIGAVNELSKSTLGYPAAFDTYNPSFGQITSGKYAYAPPGVREVLDPSTYMGWGVMEGLQQSKRARDIAKLTRPLTEEERILRSFSDLTGPDNYYRIVRGEEPIQDILSTGKIRSRGLINPTVSGSGTINLKGRPTAWPSFSKESPSLSYAEGDPNHYIVESSRPMSLSTKGRHGAGSTYFPVDSEGNLLKEFPAEEAKVWRHTGEGNYELVDLGKNKQLEKVTAVEESDIPPFENILKEMQSHLASSKNKGAFLEKKSEIMKRLSTPEGQRRIKNLLAENPHYNMTPEEFYEWVGKTEWNPDAEFDIKTGGFNAYAGRNINPGWIQYPGAKIPLTEQNPKMFLGTGYNPYEVQHTAEHEFAHVMQPFHQEGITATTSLDQELGKLELHDDRNLWDIEDKRFIEKGFAEPPPSAQMTSVEHSDKPLNLRKDKEYFLKGKSKTAGDIVRENERWPFAAEVRQEMLGRGFIDHMYDEISPELLQDFYNTYMKTGSGQYSLRLFEIMKNKPENFKILSDVMNKMPVIVPGAVGAGYIMNQPGSESEQPTMQQGGAFLIPVPYAPYPSPNSPIGDDIVLDPDDPRRFLPRDILDAQQKEFEQEEKDLFYIRERMGDPSDQKSLEEKYNYKEENYMKAYPHLYFPNHFVLSQQRMQQGGSFDDSGWIDMPALPEQGTQETMTKYYGSLNPSQKQYFDSYIQALGANQAAFQNAYEWQNPSQTRIGTSPEMGQPSSLARQFAWDNKLRTADSLFQRANAMPPGQEQLSALEEYDKYRRANQIMGYEHEGKYSPMNEYQTGGDTQMGRIGQKSIGPRYVYPPVPQVPHPMMGQIPAFNEATGEIIKATDTVQERKKKDPYEIDTNVFLGNLKEFGVPKIHPKTGKRGAMKISRYLDPEDRFIQELRLNPENISPEYWDMLEATEYEEYDPNTGQNIKSKLAPGVGTAWDATPDYMQNLLSDPSFTNELKNRMLKTAIRDTKTGKLLDKDQTYRMLQNIGAMRIVEDQKAFGGSPTAAEFYDFGSNIPFDYPAIMGMGGGLRCSKCGGMHPGYKCGGYKMQAGGERPAPWEYSNTEEYEQALEEYKKMRDFQSDSAVEAMVLPTTTRAFIDPGVNSSVNIGNMAYSNARAQDLLGHFAAGIDQSPGSMAAQKAYYENRDKMVLSNEEVVDIARTLGEGSNERISKYEWRTIDSPLYGKSFFNLEGTVTPLDAERIVAEFERQYPDKVTAKKAAKKPSLAKQLKKQFKKQEGGPILTEGIDTDDYISQANAMFKNKLRQNAVLNMAQEFDKRMNGMAQYGAQVGYPQMMYNPDQINMLNQHYDNVLDYEKRKKKSFDDFYDATLGVLRSGKNYVKKVEILPEARNGYVTPTREEQDAFLRENRGYGLDEENVGIMSPDRAKEYGKIDQEDFNKFFNNYLTTYFKGNQQQVPGYMINPNYAQWFNNPQYIGTPSPAMQQAYLPFMMHGMPTSTREEYRRGLFRPSLKTRTTYFNMPYTEFPMPEGYPMSGQANGQSRLQSLIDQKRAGRKQRREEGVPRERKGRLFNRQSFWDKQKSGDIRDLFRDKPSEMSMTDDERSKQEAYEIMKGREYDYLLKKYGGIPKAQTGFEFQVPQVTEEDFVNPFPSNQVVDPENPANITPALQNQLLDFIQGEELGTNQAAQDAARNNNTSMQKMMMRETFGRQYDPEAVAAFIPTGIDVLTNLFNQDEYADAKKRMKQMTFADNAMYAMPSGDRGDYLATGAGSGMLKNQYSIGNFGNIASMGMQMYQEGGVYELDEDQIQQIIAAGGNVTYID